MNTSTDRTHLHRIGIGELGWRPCERITDRYGTIGLYRGQKPISLEHISSFEGTHGHLTCRVKGVRPCLHLGDILRGLRPEQPKVGEVFILGEGNLFIEDGKCIGVEPTDGRETDWLDPHQLYKVHSQIVELFFVESNNPSR